MRHIVLIAAATLCINPVWAATQSITLKVPDMICPICPITVRKALQRVPGISRITVNYAKKEVVVTFDDVKTNEAALVKATTDAGYPSQPINIGR
ncbi:MAG: mercury resistance system periplasmic binding protein MerP [Bryobacteraceae bacterium]